MIITTDEVTAALAKDPRQARAADLAVDDDAEKERVGDGDHRGLGRGEDAAEDAAQDDDRHEERQRRPP
jgi:hypothetical protein